MLNHIVLMGRLAADPELRYTQQNVPVCGFALAVERDFSSKDGGEKQTDFIDCTAWRGTGEFISRYFQKGAPLLLSGRLQIKTWTDKDGNKRRNAEVLVDHAYFAGGKGVGAGTAPALMDFEVEDGELPWED